MSAGIGQIGREIVVTVGGSGLVGVISKGFSFNNEALDTTDDDASGWQERLALPGVKSLELSISGLLKNLELIEVWSSGSQLLPIVATFVDGSTLTFDGFMDSFSETGESNGLATFDATFSSSGSIAFVPGI